MFVDSPHDGTLTPPRPLTLPRPRWAAVARRRRLLITLLALLSALPVAFVLFRASEARRNVAYWDEIDTAVALVLKLREGTTPTAFLHDLFSVNNEHRMVTSRLMFATSYWLTGTVNFSTIGMIGNASAIGLVALLLAATSTTRRRLTLGALLACLLFQLEHYENFLWSGASIDHFLVVFFAAAAVVALARATTGSVALGAVFGFLATFTLAHGLVVWPVGGAMLLGARRPRLLVGWIVAGLVSVAIFLTGFAVNGAQAFADVSVDSAVEVLHYWLSILGSVPALGQPMAAPIFGGVLLALVVLAALRGAIRREPIALPLALFAIGAAALIAVGRAEQSGGVVFSRYYVLSALAWALTLFMLIERFTHPRRPLQLISAVFPALLAFNLVATREFTDEAESWLECRDRAVARFKQHGMDGRGVFSLHPIPSRSTAVLTKAEELGVYRLGGLCFERPFPASARESSRIVYYVDEMTINPRSAYVGGWVGIPGERSRRGRVHVILRSATETLLYTTVTISRPDVAKENKQPGWSRAGFSFVRLRDRLPTGTYQLGFLITDGHHAEYVMTAHRLKLEGDGQPLLASGD